MTTGKYAGKTISEIAKSDMKYVQYLRANGNNEQKAIAVKLLEDKPPMPEPVKSQVSFTPTTTPPVITETGQAVQPPLPAPKASVIDSEQKVLVGECKELMKKIPEFQGAGIAKNMIPFLRSVIGGPNFDYMAWAVPDLINLKTRLLEKTLGQ